MDLFNIDNNYLISVQSVKMSDHGEATTTSVKKKSCVIGDGCCKHFDLMWYISRDCPVGNCVPGCNLSFSATVEVDSTLVELSLEDCPGMPAS